MRTASRLVFAFLIFFLSAAFAQTAVLPFQSEVAPDASGRLSFEGRSWWPRAKALKEGESLKVDARGDRSANAIVKRDGGDIVEAIDETGTASDPWNQVSTIYLVSYKGTGVVDRMVAYYDTDHDGKADEMEIRYYESGVLRYGLFGENFDGNGIPVFELRHWEYFEGGTRNYRKGNALIYYNKYDAATRSWMAWGECPFAFSDATHRGTSDSVVRLSVVPEKSLTGDDPDFANNLDGYRSSVSPSPADMVVGNVRLSYRLEPSAQSTHFTFGFTMFGDAPAAGAMTAHTLPLRPPPQTVYRPERERALQVALAYPAQQTGFTWDETGQVDRWEGQFWTWDRRPIQNTGGPTQRWNLRHEYSDKASESRQLYYSPLDRRIHLFGAVESWIEVGHLVNDRKDLEIRAWDADHDGFLDTWEVFEGGNAQQARTFTVSGAQNQMLALDREALGKLYFEEVLPKVISEDESLIGKLRSFAEDRTAESYLRAATNEPSPERKRLLLDSSREVYFLRAMKAARERNATRDLPGRPFVSEPGRRTSPTTSEWMRHPRYSYWRWREVKKQHSSEESVRYWDCEVRIRKIEQAYGSGDFAAVEADLAPLFAALPPPVRHSSVSLWLLVGMVLAVAYLLFSLRRPSRV
ncbi:hypothetical protein [Candidatus Korobacter versatilis]|uniref:hypothetical protein n=1 Tax=Candidatus Korobacter versatilis TaxID=658062 RepID=UPI0011D15A77|nr:hypothetical protein [Candidatus Koribacter versatilis]